MYLILGGLASSAIDLHQARSLLDQRATASCKACQCRDELRIDTFDAAGLG